MIDRAAIIDAIAVETDRHYATMAGLLADLRAAEAAPAAEQTGADTELPDPGRRLTLGDFQGEAMISIGRASARFRLAKRWLRDHAVAEQIGCKHGGGYLFSIQRLQKLTGLP